MYAVNSSGETIDVSGNVIHFLKPELKLERMNIFGALLRKNFRERVDFTYAHQPLYTNEMVIFYCKTKFSSASKIVCESLEIEKHLDEPIEKLDLMRSLFQCKEDGRVCWYYLTVGAYVIERNFYDCEPINVRYIQPTSYCTFLRKFRRNLISEEELKKGTLCKKYELLDGMDMNNAPALLSCAFERDILDGKSEKDAKMSGFAHAWKQQKINPGGEYSNVATLCFMNTSYKRRDCYLNYKEVKNMIRKAHKGAHSIIYRNNTITAVLPDGRNITVYVYGTVEAPKYLFSGKMTTSIDTLQELIRNREDEHESKWFTVNVKPYL